MKAVIAGGHFLSLLWNGEAAVYERSSNGEDRQRGGCEGMRREGVKVSGGEMGSVDAAIACCLSHSLL